MIPVWIFLAVLALVLYRVWLKVEGDRSPKLTIARVEEVPGSDDLIVRTVNYGNFRGSVTVWHELPSGKRAPTWIESQLSEAWIRHKWQKECGHVNHLPGCGRDRRGCVPGCSNYDPKYDGA